MIMQKTYFNFMFYSAVLNLWKDKPQKDSKAIADWMIKEEKERK